ncbi:MAG: GNAT family N-acetyltransferase [Bacteroidaceae bacterium]|jgi:predicted N-acetyltransferase YhbS
MSDDEIQLRRLYHECFHDDPAFEDAYFRYLYSRDRSVISKRKGQVVSGLIYTDCGLNVASGLEYETDAAYLSGICTHPSWRGRGLAGQLIRRTLAKCYQAGYGYATLIPADAGLAGYYARFGFANCFDYVEETYYPSPEELALPDLLAAEAVSEEGVEFAETTDYLYEGLPSAPLLYYRFTGSGLTSSLYYTDMRVLTRGYLFGDDALHDLRIEDVYLYGGMVWKVATQEREIVAEAIVYPRDGHLLVTSLVCDNVECRMYMLSLLAAHYRLPEIHIIRPPRLFTPINGTPIGLEGELAEGETDGIATSLVARRGRSDYSPVRPLGMARLVAADMLVPLVAEAYPEVMTSFSLNDPILPENSGVYTLPGDGTAYFHKRGKAPQVTVAQLTQALIGYHVADLPEALRCFPTGIPYMHTMLNK